MLVASCRSSAPRRASRLWRRCWAMRSSLTWLGTGSSRFPIRPLTRHCATRSSKLKGRPLIGVIGSLGVRRDTKAVGPLAELLKDTDADVAQAAARALGRIGGGPATEALETALGSASAANQLAFSEGLFRCADRPGGTRKEQRSTRHLREVDSLRLAPSGPLECRSKSPLPESRSRGGTVASRGVDSTTEPTCGLTLFSLGCAGLRPAAPSLYYPRPCD